MLVHTNHDNINLLTWESKLFSRRLGRVVFDSTTTHIIPSSLSEFTLVQAKLATHAMTQINKLIAIGFLPVEGEIDCCYTILTAADDDATLITNNTPIAEIRIAIKSDIPALRTLVMQAIVQSRFRAPWFNDEERQLFYAQWVENAVLGSFDHLCLVAQRLDRIMGLVTIRYIGGQKARIGLLAVSPDARGCGTGKLLCRAARSWCRGYGFKQLWVATQSTNLPALRLYLASGAQIMHTYLWLYRGSHDSI